MFLLTLFKKKILTTFDKISFCCFLLSIFRLQLSLDFSEDLFFPRENFISPSHLTTKKITLFRAFFPYSFLSFLFFPVATFSLNSSALRIIYNSTCSRAFVWELEDFNQHANSFAIVIILSSRRYNTFRIPFSPPTLPKVVLSLLVIVNPSSKKQFKNVSSAEKKNNSMNCKTNFKMLCMHILNLEGEMS